MLDGTREKLENSASYLEPDQLVGIYKDLNKSILNLQSAKHRLNIPDGMDEEDADRYSQGVESMFVALGTTITDYEALRELIAEDARNTMGEKEFLEAIR